MHIILMQSEDWPAIKFIYEAGLATGNASFQTSAPSWEEWDNSHLKHSRLVMKVDGEIAGWAAHCYMNSLIGQESVTAVKALSASF